MSWHPVGGTHIGSSHVAAGQHNEDAWHKSGRGQFAAVAVADGHGSKRCPRAREGARFAVEILVEELMEVGGHDLDSLALETALRERVGSRLIKRWREQVKGDAAAHPFTPAERAEMGSGDNESHAALLAYGCTVMAALGTPHAVGVLQIGDGDIVAVADDGHRTVSRPLPDDPTNVANVTASLSQPEAFDHLRVRVMREPQLLVWASTDGFGGAYTDPEWWRQVGAELAERRERLPLDEIERRIPEWLAEPANVAGDDTTMAMLLRDTRSRPRALTTLSVAPALVGPKRDQGGRGPGRVTAAVAALGVLLVVTAVFFSGLLFGRSGSGQAEVASAPPAAEPTLPAVEPLPPPPPEHVLLYGEFPDGSFVFQIDPRGPGVVVAVRPEMPAQNEPIGVARSPSDVWLIDGTLVRHLTLGLQLQLSETDFMAPLADLELKAGRVWVLADDGRLVWWLPDDCHADCQPRCLNVYSNEPACPVEPEPGVQPDGSRGNGPDG
ncbi:MAG: PP2C family serine/threonine-protein phosphatase [Egibacteraceae bacterium]